MGSGGVGNVFRAVREQHVPVDAVSIPMLRASELHQVGFAECLHVSHGDLFRLSAPHGGGERARLPPQPSAAVIAFWGDRAAGGAKTASLTASGVGYSAFAPSMFGSRREWKLGTTAGGDWIAHAQGRR